MFYLLFMIIYSTLKAEIVIYEAFFSFTDFCKYYWDTLLNLSVYPMRRM